MTKYNRLLPPEVQANTTSSQTPPTGNSDLEAAVREPRIHPTDKDNYAIVMHPQSEHKLTLVNE
jgi:hypothetical protein